MRTTFQRLTFVSLLLAAATSAEAATVTFEEFGLPADSYHNGDPADTNVTLTNGNFKHGSVAFENEFTTFDGGWTSWDGWALSNKTDTTTAGFQNQYSAIAGGGVDGSSTYGVAFYSAPFGTFAGHTPTISLDTPSVVEGAYFTNTVYTYLAMVAGDTGNVGFNLDPFSQGDYFLLTITGLGANDEPLGTIDYYLADYQSSNEDDWYAIDDWEWLDLSGLGEVKALEFTFSGTDIDSVLGLNTPTYVAMDNFTLAATNAVPEPATAVLALLAGLGIAVLRHRRQTKTRRAESPKGIMNREGNRTQAREEA